MEADARPGGQGQWQDRDVAAHTNPTLQVGSLFASGFIRRAAG